MLFLGFSLFSVAASHGNMTNHAAIAASLLGGWQAVEKVNSTLWSYADAGWFVTLLNRADYAKRFLTIRVVKRHCTCLVGFLILAMSDNDESQGLKNEASRWLQCD